MWIIPKNHPAPCLPAPDTAGSSWDLPRLSDLCASSLTWRGKPTPAKTWLRRLRPGGCLARLSGRIFVPLTPDRSGGVLTSLLAATHASPLASPESVLAPTTPATSGPSTSASSENADPRGGSLRTCAGTCPKDCARCDATWKAWAIGLRLDYSRRKKSGRTIGGKGSISLLPTPTATSYGSNCGGAAGRTGRARPSLETMARHNLWPTPTVCGNYNRKGLSERSGDGLAQADRLRPWPTPTARDWKDTGSFLGEGLQRTLGRAVCPSTTGGSLNPDWVDWLMGLPIGWTDSDSPGTELSPSAQRTPSAPCTAALPIDS